MTSRDIVRGLLDEKGISQAELARLLGSSRSAINALIKRTDRRDISVPTLCHILEVLGYRLMVVHDEAKIEGESYKVW